MPNLPPTTLTTAEFTLLVSALGARPDPFIDDSALEGLDDDELTHQLRVGRLSTQLRGLASVADDGALDPGSDVRTALHSVVQGSLLVQLMHARAGEPPARVWLGVADTRAANAHWASLRAIDAAWFELAGMSGLDAAAQHIAAITQLDALPAAADSEVNAAVTLPASILGQIASTEATPNIDLPKLLKAAGMPETQAQLLANAGMRPMHQSVLTVLTGNDASKTLNARALIWFGDAESTWVTEQIGNDGTIRLRRASPGNTLGAIATLLQAATA